VIEANEVISLLQDVAQKFGNQPFLIEEGHVYSFAEIEQLTNKLSDGMRHHGIKKGDHVAFCLEGRVETVVVRLAAQKLGALIVPINNRLIGPEIEYILRDSESSWVVVDSCFLPEFQKIHVPGLLERPIVVGEVPPGISAVSYQDLLNRGSPVGHTATIDPDSAAMILYTSGTTGRPKGAVIRHRNSMASAQWIKHVYGIHKGDVVFSSTPLYNASSLNGVFIACMMVRVPFVLARRFSPRDVLNKIEQLRVTVYSASAPMMVMIINHESFSQRNLSSLRLITLSNAARLASMEQLHESLPNTDIFHVYGFTESSPVGAHISLENMRERPGSCGRLNPQFGAFRVVDEKQRDLPSGQIGEVIHQSGGLMREYYNKSEATRKAIKNGWFYTGDLGKMDDDGYLYIVGRLKEMINRAGEKVYAQEVEQVLLQHPAVVEVAVIGISHEVLGEEVKAFIVLKKGAQVTEEELIAHCKGKLAHFKIPTKIEFKTEFPRNSLGKILKYKLVP